MSRRVCTARRSVKRLPNSPPGPTRRRTPTRSAVLVLLGLLPALAEADLEAFGESLHDFNARVGEAFRRSREASIVGRASPSACDPAEEGVRGVGQSSWGPTVFAVVGGEERASDLRRRLADRFGLAPAEAWTTPACNDGSRVIA